MTSKVFIRLLHPIHSGFFEFAYLHFIPPNKLWRAPSYKFLFKNIIHKCLKKQSVHCNHLSSCICKTQLCLVCCHWVKKAPQSCLLSGWPNQTLTSMRWSRMGSVFVGHGLTCISPDKLCSFLDSLRTNVRGCSIMKLFHFPPAINIWIPSIVLKLHTRTVQLFRIWTREHWDLLSVE